MGLILDIFRQNIQVTTLDVIKQIKISFVKGKLKDFSIACLYMIRN